MKATKIPTDCILSDKEMKCLKTYNERQRRQFLASKAEAIGCHGVSSVCNAIGVCRDTLYRGKHELDTDANASFPDGRIRKVMYAIISYLLREGKNANGRIPILLIEEPENHLFIASQIELSKTIFSESFNSS